MTYTHSSIHFMASLGRIHISVRTDSNDTSFLEVTDDRGYSRSVISGDLGTLRHIADAIDGLVAALERGDTHPKPVTIDPDSPLAQSYEQPDRALRDAWLEHLEHLEQRRVPTATTYVDGDR